MGRSVCQPQGTGGGGTGWKVPGSSASNCPWWAVIAFGVDHGAALPTRCDGIGLQT